MSKFDWKPLEQYVQHVLDAYGLPGTAVAAAKDGKIVYASGFGWRDREENLPVTENTVFGIGSITKSFTAVAIMQLVEEGKLCVEDLVTDYLPQFRAGKTNAHETMTIHNLLTHTGGLPPLPSLYPAMARSMMEDATVKESAQFEQLSKMTPIDTYEQLMEFIAKQDFDLLGPAGMHFSYSNDGWALLGAIIEKVTGKKYEAVIDERILEPCGMRHTTFDLKLMETFPEVTMLYISKDVDGKEQVIRAPGWWESPVMAAAGFLRSTVPDLIRYMEIYRTGGDVYGTRILSKQSVERMTMLHASPNPGAFYGYGLMVTANYHGVSLVEHGGGIKGVSAWVTCAPEAGVTTAVLANLGGVPSGQIALDAANVMLGVPVGTKRHDLKPYACPEERLERYAGMYVSGEGATLKVSVVEGGLECESQGKKHSARPVGVDMFAVKMKEEEMMMRFLMNPAGQAWAVSFGFRIVPKATTPPNELGKLIS